MPANATNIYLEHESLRLGLLWRSQGEKFLEEQAASIVADVERLRESYLAGLRHQAPARPVRRTPPSLAKAAKVIDLRDDAVSKMACSREGHNHVFAEARCVRCRNVFCESHVVRPDMMHGYAICTECALTAAGVNHTRLRPLVAPGRSARRR